MELLESLQTEEFFKDCSFSDLDLTGFRFAGKEFFRCTFRSSKLSETRWSEARLEDCTFEDCDLSQSSPGDLSATGVRFQRCKLMGVTFEKLPLSTRLAFEECSLRYTTFAGTCLRRTPFLRCRAQEASFLDCDLQESDFSGTDLTAATFQGCDLRSAEFSTAEGAFVDPAKNRVKGLRISVQAAAALARSFGMRVA